MLNRILLIALVSAVSAFAQSVWNGTANTDWYNETALEFTITTAEELAGLAKLVNDGKTFSGNTIKLGANIMLNDTTNWQNWETNPPARTWTAIRGKSNIGPAQDFNNSFRGVFDGNGYVVSGVYINMSYLPDYASIYQGLFARSSGNISNLGVSLKEMLLSGG